MSKNKIDYSGQNFSPNKLSVGIDFSKVNTINYQNNSEKQVEGEIEKAQAELVSFARVDKTVRPMKSKIQLGSYISQENLQKILNKSHKDRSYYSMLEYVRKNEKAAIALREDFDCIRDFFPIELVREVEDYCRKIIPKVAKRSKEQGLAKLTPRKRRGYILAVFRAVTRKNGRKFTEHLLEEINNRFNYERRIKIFEVCKAENDLIDWNLLAKKPERDTNDLRTFYLNLITNLNRLKKNKTISENKEYLEILTITQKYITKFTTSKEHKKTLTKLIKHQEKDFASRLIIWTIAKYYAQEKYDIVFKDAKEMPGWKELFLIENSETEEKTKQVPIRSFKFIFWAEFHLRNKLKEFKLFPEES